MTNFKYSVHVHRLFEATSSFSWYLYEIFRGQGNLKHYFRLSIFSSLLFITLTTLFIIL